MGFPGPLAPDRQRPGGRRGLPVRPGPRVTREQVVGARLELARGQHARAPPDFSVISADGRGAGLHGDLAARRAGLRRHRHRELLNLLVAKGHHRMRPRQRRRRHPHRQLSQNEGTSRT